MKIVIAWWNLNASSQTIQSLQQSLKIEDLTCWEKIKGLRLKCWISDPINNLWGAIMLWESNTDMHQPLPPNRATELIGYPPNLRHVFEVEATVEGDYDNSVLKKYNSYSDNN